MAFIYDKHVLGKDFIGRRKQASTVENILRQNENIVISEPPKSGKTSLIQHTLYNMKSGGTNLVAVSCSFLACRSFVDVCSKLGGELIKAIAGTPTDMRQAISEYLAGTHFVFDSSAYESKGCILSLNWDLDDNDIRSVLSLPYRLAQGTGTRIVVVIDEFQNILRCEDGEHFCKLFEDVIKECNPERLVNVNYILTGSAVNAMSYIFRTRHLFFKQYCPISLDVIETKDIVDHVMRGFAVTGKVFDQELLLGVCKIFRNNIYYINHIASICDSLTRGYIVESLIKEAFGKILAIHEPEFKAIMNDLTTFQTSLLKAILEGNTRFSSSEVIKNYNLNSSANVKRLKEALMRKEIVYFNEKDEASVIDPLFEYWARKYFFELG